LNRLKYKIEKKLLKKIDALVDIYLIMDIDVVFQILKYDSALLDK
jgi:hypothetical protein